MERLIGTLAMVEALHYTWTHPVSTSIIGYDHPGYVEANAEASRVFADLTAHQMRDPEARPEPIAR